MYTIILGTFCTYNALQQTNESKSELIKRSMYLQHIVNEHLKFVLFHLTIKQ